MIQKELEQITESDLQLLIDNAVCESKTIEYKKEIDISTGDKKKEFLADVLSFANANGGDLIIGIIENRVNGEPESLCGIHIDNKDQFRLQLENIIRDGISPRLPRVEVHLISLSNSNDVVIVRVQKSWISPHRVEYGGSHKFFSRNSSGKYPLDVGELRTAFTLSQTMTEKIKRFREDRISKIFSNEMPVSVENDSIIVLHMIPMNAFELLTLYDLREIIDASNCVSVIRAASGHNCRINFDGYITYTGDNTSPSYSYNHFYKNGIIEIVNTSLLDGTYRGSDEKIIPSKAFEEVMIDVTEESLNYYRRLGVDLPIIVFLSLINIKGYKMGVSSNYNASANFPINRDILLSPEVVISDYNISIEKILKSSFDAIWNACGWMGSINYDRDGNWKK